jgi:hypothetical protein
VKSGVRRNIAVNAEVLELQNAIDVIRAPSAHTNASSIGIAATDRHFGFSIEAGRVVFG